MKYVKLIPLAISIAMLITLVYMTFVPSYYLSATLHNSALSQANLSQTYEQGNLNLALNENIFQKGIGNLSLRNVDLALSLVSTAQEMLKINQLAKEGKRQELFIKLKQRLFITQAKDTLDFKLHVTKHSVWKNIFDSSLSNKKDLDNVKLNENKNPIIAWKINDLRVFLVFFITAFLSYILALILLSAKHKLRP